MTKLDVLDGLESISICVGYENEDSHNPTPIYEHVPGWSESTVGVQRMEDLPQNALDYLDKIQSSCGVVIDFVSTGPDREDTIQLRNPFDMPKS